VDAFSAAGPSHHRSILESGAHAPTWHVGANAPSIARKQCKPFRAHSREEALAAGKRGRLVGYKRWLGGVILCVVERTSFPRLTHRLSFRFEPWREIHYFKQGGVPRSQVTDTNKLALVHHLRMCGAAE
jgi:hypothetical protein